MRAPQLLQKGAALFNLAPQSPQKPKFATGSGIGGGCGGAAAAE
jgi:hypothetical protein